MRGSRIEACRVLLFCLLFAGCSIPARAKETTSKLGPVRVHVALTPDARTGSTSISSQRRQETSVSRTASPFLQTANCSALRPYSSGCTGFRQT